MFTRMSFLTVAIAILALAAGCSDIPTAQFDAGKTALDSARLAEAELYAPDLYKAAADSLNAASVEVEKQNGRFAPLRSYGQAEAALVAAKQLADQATAEAANQKEQLRLADSVLIADIESLITDARNLLASAPGGKGTRVDIKVLHSDIDAAAAALTSAAETYRTGQYLTANDRLLVVKTQVSKVQTEVAAAIARLKKN